MLTPTSGTQKAMPMQRRQSAWSSKYMQNVRIHCLGCFKCKDPLFGMLVLKTVSLLDVKGSPYKIFYGYSLNTNFPRPNLIHPSYEDRFINQDASGILPSTRNFEEDDPVWVKINKHFPWRPGIIVKVCPNQSFDVQVDDKMYHHNVHYLS